ncbi:hypothetical protein FE257_004902 [Aspergillus nanangensis]|uniref:Uncharacterized protein n=1 Tax=Aspergillus nanangensis TaxID=2582783 RepID=A0AAD4CAM1_ASPNN|nr:hypothetical protein FE257_004902 [Aspergillus nanangensis]
MEDRDYVTSTIVFITCWLLCHASPVEVPQPNGIENSFSLYAYGDNLSGWMITHADGQAELSELSESKADDTEFIYFTASGPTSRSWVAHLNNTDSGRNATFGSKIPYLAPQSGSEVANVSFIDSEDTSRQDTPSLYLYGSYVLIDSVGANFYAVPSGVYGKDGLAWSSGIAIQSDKIPIVLRTTAPANTVRPGLGIY